MCATSSLDRTCLFSPLNSRYRPISMICHLLLKLTSLHKNVHHIFCFEYKCFLNVKIFYFICGLVQMIFGFSFEHHWNGIILCRLLGRSLPCCITLLKFIPYWLSRVYFLRILWLCFYLFLLLQLLLCSPLKFLTSSF